MEPLLLMVGLTAAGMPASGASLLLNAEGVILPHCWRGSFSRKPLTAAHYWTRRLGRYLLTVKDNNHIRSAKFSVYSTFSLLKNTAP